MKQSKSGMFFMVTVFLCGCIFLNSCARIDPEENEIFEERKESFELVNSYVLENFGHFDEREFVLVCRDDEKEIELHEDFDIDEPVIKVSTSATESREISILVGKDYPYVATLNGETLESTYQDGMLTLTIPEGDNNIEIRGEHQCVFDQHATNILNIKEWANCDHGNIYYVSCVCQRNGTETFEDEQVRGHKLSKVEAVAATETEDGCIEHWKCTRCDRLFADAKGTQELNAADVVVNKLTSDAPQSNVLLIVGIVAGAVVLAGAIVAVIIIKKRKTK